MSGFVLKTGCDNWLDQRAKYKEDQRVIEAAYKQDINSTT
jgi:hypothetical protein